MSVNFLRHAGSAQEGACMATPILWYTVLRSTHYAPYSSRTAKEGMQPRIRGGGRMMAARSRPTGCDEV